MPCIGIMVNITFGQGEEICTLCHYIFKANRAIETGCWRLRYEITCIAPIGMNTYVEIQPLQKMIVEMEATLNCWE